MTSAPDNQSVAAVAWREAALAALRERGHRTGGARTAVIERLAAGGGCVEAEELARDLRQAGDQVATASVYRALTLLGEIGLLHRIALPSAPARFELVLPDGAHHHHLVCANCGSTDAFSDEALEQAIQKISARTAFEVRSHDITLHGRCAACRAAAQ